MNIKRITRTYKVDIDPIQVHQDSVTGPLYEIVTIHVDVDEMDSTPPQWVRYTGYRLVADGSRRTKGAIRGPIQNVWKPEADALRKQVLFLTLGYGDEGEVD